MKVDYSKAVKMIDEGKTNKQIADVLGCDPSAISHIKRGFVKGNRTTDFKLVRFKIALENAVVKSESGCWLLETSVSPVTGYAVRSFMGKSRSAHVASYLAFIGDIPEGMVICHKCDVKNCVNPDHLFLGTQSDNMKDASVKGRISKGEKHYKALLTEAIVRDMRQTFVEGTSWADLGRKYGVSRAVALSVITRKSWKHI